MYLVVSALCFIAQNDDRKLGMPTTQASHKNYIWNVMYDIQINYNKHQKVTRFFQSRVRGKTKKRLHRVEYMPQQHNPGAQDLNLESHHRTVISAIHWIGLMLCNTVPHAGGNLTLLLLPMPAISAESKMKCCKRSAWLWIVITYQNDRTIWARNPSFMLFDPSHLLFTNSKLFFKPPWKT